MENQLTAQDQEVINDITNKIKEACEKSKYTHLCMRVKNENGMAYVVNRCITMMAKDNIKLSMALASLESEFEGTN